MVFLSGYKLGRHRLVCIAAVFAFFTLFSTAGFSTELEDASTLFNSGQYEECLKTSRQAIEIGAYATKWRILIMESLMALGRYEEAVKYTDEILLDYRSNIRLFMLSYHIYLQSGQVAKAGEILSTVYQIATVRRFEYMNNQDIVAMGQSLLLLGGEPRLILDEFYNRAINNDPNCIEAYLAAGELALTKQDYELAAEQYRKVIEQFGDNADAHYGLAKAFYYSDRQVMIQSLDAALHVNPNHAPSLILLAEHLIDCEDGDGAAKRLDRVISVNPWNSEAWAYRSLLAQLANDPNKAESCRASALKYWETNPKVDYLIGRKLSQKYRFAEGAKYQRQALKFDPDYLPAKIQLAEDMLRLGKEETGWSLADQVSTSDPYNIQAYNLVNLHDNMSRFKTLDGKGFIIRMSELEADVYGDQVIDLLEDAKETLCKKYGVQLEGPVTVELFPNQQDFAVRTFGMPGGDGYQGVCFGNVITANSPKAQRPSNWKSMLWHEFGHVVTLNLTHNKMPRWLSEGISVYEESQRNPICGQRMIPEYREWILSGELTPVSKLSSAFMNPATPMHLQFAYYESSLVVEFLVEQFGFDTLKGILRDMAQGEEINESISKRAEPIEKVEKHFEEFARKKAEALAPGLDWEQPDKDQVDPADHKAVVKWLTQHPNSLWGLSLHAANLLSEEKWQEAIEPLEKLISLYPSYIGQGNAYELLAEVYRNLEQSDKEYAVLKKLAAVSSEAGDTYGRLMEIAMEKENWQEVVENGEKYLAVYPMLGTCYWRLGRASEGLGLDDKSIDAYKRVLLLNPADPVDINYRLAKLLQQRDPVSAKRYVLEALVDAPRFREGHHLLLKLIDSTNEAAKPKDSMPETQENTQ